MDITVTPGDIARVEAPAVVVNLFEGVTSPGGATGAVDAALGGAISRLIADGEIKGRLGEVTTIHTLGRIPPERVIVAGLGKAGEFTLDRVRRVAAETVRAARRMGLKRLATITHGAGIGGLDPLDATEAVAEGSMLGSYRFRHHFSSPDDGGEVELVTIVERDESRVGAMQGAAERGKAIAGAMLFARDKANEPGNHLTPTLLAEAASKLAEETGLAIEVYDRHQIRAMGMTAFLGVAQGSEQPPKLIVLHYRGDPDATQPAIGLVGKGITFDSGGISIKPATNMGDMKGDMGGGGAVIGAMGAIARLKPKINVTGIVPATENLPSGTAYKPGDVLRALNGKTIEVVNTDAEGRVILSDALAYACQLGLLPVIDVATLTGACGVALGDVCSGLFGSDQALVNELLRAGEQAGERLWQLPLYDDYLEQIKGDAADFKNSGGAPAGAITAAIFLRQFVDDRPWAHLDIAGTDLSSRERGIYSKGATGIGARTLVRFVLARAAAGQA